MGPATEIWGWLSSAPHESTRLCSSIQWGCSGEAQRQESPLSLRPECPLASGKGILNLVVHPFSVAGPLLSSDIQNWQKLFHLRKLIEYPLRRGKTCNALRGFVLDSSYWNQHVQMQALCEGGKGIQGSLLWPWQFLFMLISKGGPANHVWIHWLMVTLRTLELEIGHLWYL